MPDSIDPADFAGLNPVPNPDLDPDPTTVSLSAPEAETDSTAVAIARCRDAWQQAFDDYVCKNAQKDRWAKNSAEAPAALAYRRALPPLVGQQGIRDFIACVAYGISIEAIPVDRAGKLLYAAQVAAGLLQRTAKPAKST